MNSLLFIKACYTHTITQMIKLMFRVVMSSFMREVALCSFALLSDCGSCVVDLLMLALASL